jgi:tetratricopeptide (TPR) repeat protein
VTTSSAEAQAFYDQGLNYLESFLWIEAARSFHQALRHDPGLALAYEGLSRTYSGLDNPDGARHYLEKARRLASGLGDRERRRIAIRERQLEAIESLEDVAKHEAYRKAIDDALAADLDDPHLWLLRGNAEEANAAGRGQRGTAASIAFYERALRLAPDLASSHHYLVHSYETVGDIGKALEHGEAYARLAPSIPHASHMWAHDLIRVGRIEEAIVQLSKSEAAERAYHAAERIDPSWDWHHGHNLDLLASCYAHRGQLELAERTLRSASHLVPMALPTFLVHRGRYQEALAAAQTLTRSGRAQSRALASVLVGRAWIGLGQLELARRALVAAQSEIELVPRATPGHVPSRSAVEPFAEALRGQILLESGHADEGRAVLEKVIRDLRSIAGVDAWVQTLFQLESIARIARGTGDWSLARYAAEQMQDHDPSYGGSHLAMAFVLHREGDPQAVTRQLEAARRSWRDADPELPEFKEIMSLSVDPR